MRPRIAIGDKFGSWVVLEYVKPLAGRSSWRCQCACGLIRLVLAYHVHRLTQCGVCANRTELGHTRRLPGSTAVRNEILSRYKKKAQKRGYDWHLSDEQFDLLTQQDCFYCGQPPRNGAGREKTRSRFAEPFIYGGIDRQDNQIGYTPENSVPCCQRCNEWKRTMNVTEFQDHAKKIVNHLEK